MELQREGNLMALNMIDTRRRCAQCHAAHSRCSREVPACARCRERGLACSRDRVMGSSRAVAKLSRSGWTVMPRTATPSTWAQVVETYSGSPTRRSYLRRYVMPFELLLPKPGAAAQVLQMGSRVVEPRHPSETRVLLQIQYSAQQLYDTFALATRVFFHMFNPFFPLFSEQAFHADPRSPTLRRLVIQVGLERMPQSDLTRAAMRANHLSPEDLFALPVSLDTLQCLLLVLFGVTSSSLERVHFRLFCTVHRLVPLLGLHATLSSNWLERTLAEHLLSLGSYDSTLGQYTRWTHVLWVRTCAAHLRPRALRRSFASEAERIHFVASQATYHSFTLVASLSRAHASALKAGTSGLAFGPVVTKHLQLLEENFRWGWSRLSFGSALATRSRLALVLRYHSHYLQMAKLAMHIPENPTQRLAPSPVATLSSLSVTALGVAMKSIRLVCTLHPAPFGFDGVAALVPPAAFLLVHRKSLKIFGALPPLDAALSLARGFLAASAAVPSSRTTARAYLELLDFCMARQNPSPKPE